MARIPVRTYGIAVILLALSLLGAAAPLTCFGRARPLSVPGPPADLSFNFKESIATLPGGSVHATWHATVEGVNRVFYRRSPDRGKSWEPPRILSGGEVVAEHPAIAASAGHVYVAWHQQTAQGLVVVLRRSTDGGGAFEPPRPLTSSGSSSHVSLAAYGPHVQAVWGDTRSGFAEIFVRSSQDGGAFFSDELQLSDAPYESWVPNVDVHGDVAVAAWVDYQDANEEEYVRVSRDRGATWMPAIRVTHDPADSWAPSVAVRGSAIFLAWFDRRVAGVTDSDVEEPLDAALALLGLPANPAPPRDPALYYLDSFRERIETKQQDIAEAAPAWVEQGGDPAQLGELLETFQALWRAWSTGWGIFLARSPDLGTTWEPARLVSKPGGPALRPSLAVSLPHLHLGWFDGRHGNDEIYYRHSADAGTTLDVEQRVTHAPGDSRRPSLAADGRGVHILWMDDRDGEPRIWYRRGCCAASAGRGVSDAVAASDEAVELRDALAAHHSDAFGFSLACCGWDRAEAEDVLQAAYLKVLDRRARFAGRSSFRTWLFGVVRVTAAERRRQHWRRLSAWRRSGDVASEAAAPDPPFNLDAAQLRRELLALPARQREVLHLVFYGDLSIAEAGEVMGVALGTARAHYERGKHRLRQRLEVEEG